MENIKEEVYKCSKCGLCQSVCPIYLATKNEMYLPRGRYIVLNNFFNNGIKFSKKFKKDLDVCLNCNLCKDFCPSNINSAEIFTQLKYIPKLFYLKLFLIFRFYGIFNLFKKYKPIKNTGKKKVIYFEGCYNKYINAKDRNASIKLIEKAGYEAEKVVSNCCGYPYLTNGENLKFEKNSKKILELCSSSAKYIVCSCDSCYETLCKIENKEFQSKLIRLDKFLEINDFNLPEAKNAFYHKTITRNEKTYLPTGMRVINKKGSCSLMENFFMIKHPKLAKIISKEVKYSQNELENCKLITTCNLAKWGLSKQLKQKVLSYAQYVNSEINK